MRTHDEAEALSAQAQRRRDDDRRADEERALDVEHNPDMAAAAALSWALNRIYDGMFLPPELEP